MLGDPDPGNELQVMGYTMCASSLISNPNSHPHAQPSNVIKKLGPVVLFQLLIRIQLSLSFMPDWVVGEWMWPQNKRKEKCKETKRRTIPRHATNSHLVIQRRIIQANPKDALLLVGE